MPYTKKQHRVFQAIAHGWDPKKGSLSSISQAEAQRMAAEGVKRKAQRKTFKVQSTR